MHPTLALNVQLGGAFFSLSLFIHAFFIRAQIEQSHHQYLIPSRILNYYRSTSLLVQNKSPLSIGVVIIDPSVVLKVMAHYELQKPLSFVTRESKLPICIRTVYDRKTDNLVFLSFFLLLSRIVELGSI